MSAESIPDMLPSIEEQANCEELDSLTFFSRMHNPVIRQQYIDLIYDANMNKNGTSISKELIERNLDYDLSEVENVTGITFDENEPPSAGRWSVTIPICFKWPPTGQRFTARQLSAIEAHEKGHVIRDYEFLGLNSKFQEAFDIENCSITEAGLQLWKEGNEFESQIEDLRKQIKEYLFSAHEIAERMSQLKNYYGMKGEDMFTIEHLHYAMDHYIADTGLDNLMTEFFAAITPDREEKFIGLINSTGI